MAVAKFRSRARVIDLLGRQQIADVPTAMGELFKNALDAGARNAWIDFWKDEKLLVIRDDGLGMRTEDVLDRWLVLATESKYAKANLTNKWSAFADDEQKEWLRQPNYGEKGIGRLSVATLGRMTLLWSVWGKGKDKKGTLCLVHWNLFQHPIKLFDDLPIPYKELACAPTEDDVGELFSILRGNDDIQSIISDKSWDRSLREQIKSDINCDHKLLFRKTKLSWEMGTTFCILPTSEEVGELFIETTDSSDALSDRSADWLKSYHAFSTFWDPFHKHSDRDFRIHPSLSGRELKRTHRYWQPEDFSHCDHHIRIQVSKDGFAKGFIRNYESSKKSYQRQLITLPRGYSSPGEFLVEIGYVQGLRENSPLPDDMHKQMDSRLVHAGGFSIYLNNVRVQPYGAIDSDFAGFEQRRLKNAGRYYFSMLRMFGGCFFPSKEMTNLQEKAGREGFIVNGARKGLRLWLEDLFKDIADSHLGRKADRADKRLRKETKERDAARILLENNKQTYLSQVRLARGWLRSFDNQVKEQVQRSRRLLTSESNGQPGALFKECEKALDELRGLLDELRNSPGEPFGGFVIEGDALAGVEDYLAKRGSSITNLNNEIGRQAKELHVLALRIRHREDREKDILERIMSVDRKMHDAVKSLLKPAIEKARHLEDDLLKFEDNEIRELKEIREHALGGVSFTQIAADKTGELVAKLERAIQTQEEFFERQVTPKLRLLVEDITHLTEKASGSFILSEQAGELQMLKERHTFLVEMAQMGLVFETANHEHEKQVDCVKNSIKVLQKYIAPEQQSILSTLSDSFEIIDARIRMFDPLVRRRTSSQEKITGAEIEAFLNRHFPEYFAKGDLIEITQNFRAASWENIKRPVFLGAIHNIFHNALYWSHKGSGKARIRFSISGMALTISNSGPAINSADVERIFAPGFSRRPYGRGLGLYIAREALRGLGYELYCPSTPELGALDGANFTIISKNNYDNDN